MPPTCSPIVSLRSPELPARSSNGSRRDELRVRPARAPQGAWSREEGAAAEGGRAAPAARDCARPQTRLLDSRRRLAPRRARSVRARDALAGDAALTGFLRAEARPAATRRARRRRAGLEPPALGIARVHAVVRAPRAAGATVAAFRTHGSAARLGH